MPRWFALSLCAIGAALILVGLTQSRRGRETRGYSRTRGRIVASEVDVTPAPSEEGGPRYTPVIRYAYEVHGRTYDSELVSVGSPARTPAPDEPSARESVQAYPLGAEVDVWFDPRDPRRSVLVRGIPAAQVRLAVVLGLALVGVGMFGLAR